MQHLDLHNILSDQQHGFRKKRSCESQLILTIQDLASSLDDGEQIDAVLLDFSKAFDKVPHQCLLLKLQHYGLRGQLLSWIESFLTGRSQKVLVEGKSSSAWDPHTDRNTKKLEAVQRRAARFVTGDYRTTSSASDMISNLGWESLQHRRTEAKLVMMYRITFGLIDITATTLLHPATLNTRGNSLLNLKQSVTNVKEKSRDKPLFLAGDFNLSHIDWENKNIKPGGKSAHSQELLEIAEEFEMEQMQMNPTRENNNLDLFFTSHPSLVKSVNTIPGISDHDMVVIDIELKPHYKRPKRREIFTYKKANWEDIKNTISAQSQEIIHNDETVEVKWKQFKNCINETVNENVPKRLTSKRHNLAWLTKTEKKMIAKKHKLYQHARRTGKQEDWNKFKQHKNKTQRAVRQAHWNYVNSVLNTSLETGNNKPFWNYVKSKRTDNIGVSGIKCGGILHQDSKAKANILNQQFKSVFTKENKNEKLPEMKGVKYESMKDINIETHGIEKLLKNINTKKACGPDMISNSVLKECAKEIAPVLSHIFQLSIDTGELPKDWRNANVSPIFNKGDRHTAANYRPVSLTCVCCKLLEHIVCRQILNHLEQHNILTSLQHGFRSGHSCETQLITTTNDIMKTFDRKEQTDLVILDFSKAFDTVPHRKLLHKLNHYGIDGKVNNWIKAFLMDRQQQVMVEGEFSDSCSVDSGVPQGTVLGPLLFLCHINDLPNCVKSTVRLFADD